MKKFFAQTIALVAIVVMSALSAGSVLANQKCIYVVDADPYYWVFDASHSDDPNINWGDRDSWTKTEGARFSGFVGEPNEEGKYELGTPFSGVQDFLINFVHGGSNWWEYHDNVNPDCTSETPPLPPTETPQPPAEEPEKPVPSEPSQQLVEAEASVSETVVEVSKTVQPYDWTCLAEEHAMALNNSLNSSSDFVLSYAVDDKTSALSAPLNITQPLEDAFNGPVEIAESNYDPVNCKAVVTARAAGSDDNYQLILVPAYAESDWYHVVTEQTDGDVRLVGYANDWWIYVTIDGVLHRMNQWGRQLQNLGLEINGPAILHPNDEDVFFADNSIERFNVRTGETQTFMSGDVEPLAFNADGSVLVYRRGNFVMVTNLVDVDFNFIGFNIYNLAVDEDGTENGIFSDAGEQQSFTGIENIETQFRALSVQESIVVSFDWSDPQDRVTPVKFD